VHGAPFGLEELMIGKRLESRPATDPGRGYAEVMAAASQPWWADAVCAQTDPEVFFPEPGGSHRAAVVVCRRCAVQAECLSWALEHDQRFGVWGGKTELERRRMRRAARRALAQLPRGGEAA
jgi:WhiB family transcriptional regulator, redox-sensing transcriptional regulator